MIYGARQVGKTYLVSEFGKTYFDDMIYVNFEKNDIVSNMINEDITPEFIIKNLEVIFEKKIDKDKTLIFFDEIQRNPRALTSLKYFCEEASEYHIIGAGSLLGVYINEKDYSFPVGKVELLTIYPLSFEEFLFNTNNKILLDEIRECFITNKAMSSVMHTKAMDLYYDYLVVGGMPEIVQDYINNNSFISASDLQYTILESYKNDIIKYCENKQEASNILSTFDSIPNQLAKDNKKFQYKLIIKGGTSSIFGESIDWLVNAGIVNKCVKVKPFIPLKMNEEIESFKIYMGDTGLLIKSSNYPIYLIKSLDQVNEVMIGMITDNYVQEEFKINDLNLNY